MLERLTPEGLRFACRAGHLFSVPEPDPGELCQIDGILTLACTALRDRAALFGRFEVAAHRQGSHDLAARWAGLRREVEMKAEVLRRLLDHGWDDAGGRRSGLA